jgi:hypothetical protein
MGKNKRNARVEAELRERLKEFESEEDVVDRVIEHQHGEKGGGKGKTIEQLQEEATDPLARAKLLAEDAESMRKQVDEYVDAKLATFEITLNKTLAAVHRGREKLRGRGDMEALGTLGTETGEIPPVRG